MPIAPRPRKHIARNSRRRGPNVTDVLLSEKGKRERGRAPWFHFCKTLTKGPLVCSDRNRPATSWGCGWRERAAGGWGALWGGRSHSAFDGAVTWVCAFVKLTDPNLKSSECTICLSNVDQNKETRHGPASNGHS